MRYSRHNKILEIISANDVDSQDRLQELLKDAGYNVSQSTLSRDMKELQLVKLQSKNGNYKYVAGINEERPISERFLRIFRETTISWASAENLIVVKTLSGCGNASAEAIDCLELEHVVGTVSGDNTMLIVVDSKDNVQDILDEFSRIVSKTDE